MAKRTNDTGSIFKEHDRNRWVALLVVGRKDDGTLVRKKFTGSTQKAVKARLDEAIAARDAGLVIPDNRTTVGDFARWWLAEVLPGENLAPATVVWYRDILETYVLPAVGDKTLTGARAVTPHDVEAMTAKIDKSTRTKIGARVALSKVLHAAQGRGLVSRNVARLARRPGTKGEPRKIKALTKADVSTLVERLSGKSEPIGSLLPSRWLPVAVVGVTTGLRPGELLALHWADCHLTGKEPYVSVRHAITHIDGAALKAPKRDRSYRTVPLTPEAVVALKNWKKRQAEERLHAGDVWSQSWPDLVFTTEAGEASRVDVYRRAIRIALPGASPHSLRHTYATHLLEASVPIHHVAELLGDSVSVVENTYSHVLRTKFEVTAIASGILA